MAYLLLQKYQRAFLPYLSKNIVRKDEINPTELILNASMYRKIDSSKDLVEESELTL